MSRPLQRRASPPWWHKPKIAKFNQIDPALRALVRKRADGCCECCGDPLGAAWECHHRKLRSRGGQDSAANLAALCGTCHRRIHGHVAWATDHGFIVSAYEDPATVPMFLGCSLPVLLTSDGKRLAA